MNKDLFNYFTTDNISGKKCTEKWLSKNNKDVYDKIISWSDNIDLIKSIEFKRKVYHYIFNMTTIPKCKTCNGSVKYARIRDGYRTYCSDRCVKNSDDYYNKWLGALNKSISKGNIKRINTLIIKYGSDYKNIIQQNRSNNMIDKYGVSNPFQLVNVKEKRKETLKKKYGSENFNNPSKTKETRIKNGTQIDDSTIKDFNDYKKIAVNRTITIYNNNKDIINSNNQKRSVKGYHIDHIYSLKQGYLNNIPIEIITHPCNLHMIHYKDNLSKQDNCWITLENLLTNIINFKGEIKLCSSMLKEKYDNIKLIAEKILYN